MKQIPPFPLLKGGEGRLLQKEEYMLKKINHIAIAVNNLEEAAKFYQNVLGLTLSGVEVVTAQKTKVGFFKIGE
jgi:predicted enzyme related to lactoylglutathione lyase